MDGKMLLEIVGYIGSVLVVVSMLMSSIVKLRVINTIGSVISVIYAFLCGALPLALMNICLIAINVYNLILLLKTKQIYTMVSSNVDDTSIKHFMKRHKQDIDTFFPEFHKSDLSGKEAYLVCHNDTSAGLFIGERRNGEFYIDLDYTTPVYRDCSVGTFLYPQLASLGIHTLIFSHKSSETHISYMNKMGFACENGVYIRK